MACESVFELTGRVLLVTLIACGALQVLYYWFVFSRFAFVRRTSKMSANHPVSVIVCARNESKNLQKFLPSLLEQDHPDYEVILVNDCSWDDTSDFLKEYAPTQPRLKVVTIQEQERYAHGKKFAITLGIKAAKHERLLFTDADCWPVTSKWVSTMASRLSDDTEIVLGYGGYLRVPGFLNKLIRFDTALIAMQYFSFASMGNAYMGVGRNLAYKKTLFFRNKGFAKHNHLASGDDDLLVNETATASNVAISTDPDSFTRSLPKVRLGDWLGQKRRHMTTSRLYRSGHKLFLGSLAASNWFFYGSLIACLAMCVEWRVVTMVYGATLVLKFPVFAWSAFRLQEKDIIPFYVLLEPLHTLLLPFPYISQALSKKRSWR